MTVFKRIASTSKWLMVPPLLIGVGALGAAVLNQKSPKPGPPPEVARTLRVVEADRRPVVPRVVGYGLAQPSKVWRAVAEVDGRVVEVHPDLEAGAQVQAGALLVQIDRKDYQLRVDRLEAEARALEAQIEETKTTRANDAKTLEIVRESLKLGRRELERQERLLQRKAASPTEVDQQRQRVLEQQRLARELENALALAPSRLERLQAQLDATQQQIAEARRDLKRTTITAPFSGRLGPVNIEVGQYLPPNRELFELQSDRDLEVEARIPIDDLQRLFPSSRSPGDEPPKSTIELLRGLKATVRVRSGDWEQSWPARIVRVREQVEQQTRTVGVIVEVETNPGVEAVAAPLLEGTFCEVVLRGHPRSNALVVPRVAVRNGAVFVVNEEDRLERREVKVRYWVGDQAVVAGRLRDGERVVISDPTPAVEGMLVDAVPDKQNDRERLATVPSAESEAER